MVIKQLLHILDDLTKKEVVQPYYINLLYTLVYSTKTTTLFIQIGKTTSERYVYVFSS